LVAALFVSAGAALAAGTLDLPIGDPARAQREAPLRLDAVTDTATGELIGPAELARRLADTRILFIGEEHTNDEFHRVQLRVLEALVAADREVLIGLEMFPWTQQAVLDDWTAGRLDEQTFVERSRWYETWSHHWGHYRDIFLYAQRRKLPMYGINAPREVVRTVRSKGFEALEPAARERMPPALDLSSDEHRRMFRASFSADDLLHMTSLNDEQREGMYRAQVTWDAAMGWNALRALEQHGGPKAIMVVLIGAGHVTYGLGSERQIRPYFKGRISSLVPVPVRGADGGAIDAVRASYANYLWGVPASDGPGLPVLGVSLAGSMGKDPTRVIDLDQRSPAGVAGVRVGDVLLSLDGTPLTSTAALQRKTADYQWGDVAQLRIRRGEQEMTLVVPFRRAGS
jgi:uncharacterized iron-regulated protein